MAAPRLYAAPVHVIGNDDDAAYGLWLKRELQFVESCLATVAGMTVEESS